MVIFNATALFQLLTGIQTIDSTGKYVNELTGSITINNINDLLVKAVQTNIFANRDPSGKSNHVCNSLNNHHWSLEDGFVQNDLIYVAEGTEITFNMTINANVGSSFKFINEHKHFCNS